jgi:phage terminase large subunit GpA-like protein
MTKKDEHGVLVYTANVDMLKELFYARSKIKEPGPGYCHLQNAF